MGRQGSGGATAELAEDLFGSSADRALVNPKF